MQLGFTQFKYIHKINYKRFNQFNIINLFAQYRKIHCQRGMGRIFNLELHTKIAAIDKQVVSNTCSEYGADCIAHTRVAIWRFDLPAEFLKFRCRFFWMNRCLLGPLVMQKRKNLPKSIRWRVTADWRVKPAAFFGTLYLANG